MTTFHNVTLEIEASFKATNVLRPIMKTRKVNDKR